MKKNAAPAEQRALPPVKRERGKTVLVCLFLVVLMLLAGFIILRIEKNGLLEKEQNQCRIKLNAVADVIHSVEVMRESSRESFERRLQQNLRYMTTTLAEDLNKEGASCQKLFEDGAMIEIRDGSVIWPEGTPKGFSKLISAEDVLECRRVERDIPVSDGDPDAGTKRMIFTIGRVAGEYYYVDWTEESEILNDQYAFLRNETFLNMAEESFGGALLLVSAEDSSLSLLSESTAYPGITSAAELGFTPEIIEKQQQYVTVNGETCLCTYTTTENGATTLIYTKNEKEINKRSIVHTGMALLPVLIILATMVTYILNVIGYVREKRLTRLLEKRYRPKKFRQIILMAGLTGAIVVLAVSALFQTLDTLHEESVISAKSMSHLFEYLQDNMMERKAYDREQDADWNIYQGERIAARIAEHPEAGTPEKLQEYCDILGIDFIMLFDADGKETVSNSEYSGFTMDAGLGENSSDFRRLLKGVHSVTHDVSTDPVTGLTRQMAGVTMPLESESRQKQHGALIMAFIPRTLVSTKAEVSRQLQFLKSDDRLYLFTDKDTGEILYSSDSDMIGKKVTDIGMPESSLREGYTDFATVNGVSSYVTRVNQKSVAFYYTISISSLLSNKLPSALSTLIAYLVIFGILSAICMYGYNSETFKKYIRANLQRENSDEPDAEEVKEELKAHFYDDLLITTAWKGDKWANWTPEKRAKLILKLDILILVILPAILISTGNNFGGNSLLHFIMFGDWMRGLNMFSFCGILVAITLGFLVIVICNGLLSMIAGFCGRGGETICRLLYSLSRYVAALTILYYVFEYIGLSMSTYVASLGMVSLALSLGSREMVSDIMAGIMILFEHQFQVGDYVELDGSRGKVMEMGIRSTKLLTASNDIKYISNSGIRSVVNKSKNASSFTTEVVIVTGEPLEAIEEKFKAVLPEIARKARKIKGELTLAGISRVSGGGRPDRDKNVEIRFKCECKEGDFDTVRDFVNREIYLFCERENIEIR